MELTYFLSLYSSIGIFALAASLDTFLILLILSLGVATFFIANKLIPIVAQFMLKNDIYGLDINKKGTSMGQKKIPQCVGFASAVSFIIVAMITSLLIKLWQSYNSAGEIYQEIHLSYLVTILGTILLGFADDMLDLPWRYKLIFPFFIVIPTISNYYGSTCIQLPFPINLLLTQIQLGPVFLLYITLLGIYCTNTINIYAGINGLEVGQSIVTAASLLIIYGVKAFKSSELNENYYYSIYLLVSFLGCLFILFLGASIALLKRNAYPSQVFIGDTYCYFAGIVLCLAAITSQNGITIHWLLFPQLINFLYSCPQLFGFYPCPRHRLPKYIANEDKLEGIKQNMNLLNLSLIILGKQNEGNHCKKLLYFQILMSLVPIVYQIFF